MVKLFGIKKAYLNYFLQKKMKEHLEIFRIGISGSKGDLITSIILSTEELKKK